jgi:orotate phosphoribosyltransferase
VADDGGSVVPAPSGGSWIDAFVGQTVEIMKAAVAEFALAALLIVAGVILCTVVDIGVGVVCLAAGAALGYLGHRRGLADVMTERGRLDQAHERELAILAQTQRQGEIEHEERLAVLAAQERLVELRRKQLSVPELAGEVRGSGSAKSHWKVRRGEERRAAPAPAGVDALDYLIFRHTRSADAPPSDPLLPPVRHFVDLRDAALIKEDRELLVELVVNHIRNTFPDHDAYTGVLVPRDGNVALGIAVAERMGIAPVLVRGTPLFQRTTESALTGGLLILVDDVWSEGAVLRRAVELARFDNFSVSDGVLVFARREGAVVDELAESNISLVPYRNLGDSDVDDIIARVSGI